jgi:predicted acylesterase/phospholipase RssA
MDLVLSSGFLAFARHLGVLRALEERGQTIDGICGTSSGALIGALWAAGHDTTRITELVTTKRPMAWLRPHWTIWRGAFSTRAFLGFLRDMLPPTFKALERPFGVGVCGADGSHCLLTSGSLPEAVAASCAVPYLFAPVTVDGVAYRDGGASDRLGVNAWRAHRGPRDTIVHLVERSLGSSKTTDCGDACVIRTPRSGASFWSLGPVEAQIQEAHQLAMSALISS